MVAEVAVGAGPPGWVIAGTSIAKRIFGGASDAYAAKVDADLAASWAAVGGQKAYSERLTAMLGNNPGFRYGVTGNISASPLPRIPTGSFPGIGSASDLPASGIFPGWAAEAPLWTELGIPAGFAFGIYQVGRLGGLIYDLGKARAGLRESQRGASRAAARLRAAERLREAQLRLDRKVSRAPILPGRLPWPVPPSFQATGAVSRPGLSAPQPTFRQPTFTASQLGGQAPKPVKTSTAVNYSTAVKRIALTASLLSPLASLIPKRLGLPSIGLPSLPKLPGFSASSSMAEAPASSRISCACSGDEAPKRVVKNGKKQCATGHFVQDDKGTSYSVWQTTDCKGKQLDKQEQLAAKIARRAKRYLKRLSAYEAKKGVALLMGQKPPAEPTKWVRGKKRPVKELLAHVVLHEAIGAAVKGSIKKATGI